MASTAKRKNATGAAAGWARTNESIRSMVEFIRSERGCLKGSKALEFLLQERRRDNARNK